MNLKRVWPVWCRPLLLAVLLPLLSGCWSRREINELSFVMALGLDKGTAPGTYALTMQVAVPSFFSPGSPPGKGPKKGAPGRPTPVNPVWIPTTQGKDLIDAVRRLTALDSRRAFAHHSGIIVIGENLARDGILPVIDFLDREPEIRRSALVFLAKGTAQDVLQAGPSLSSIPALAVQGTSQWGQDAETFTPMILGDVIYAVASARREIALPVIYRSTGRISSKKTAEKTPDKPVGPELRISGLGLFRGGKLAGFLERSASRGYLWLSGRAKKGVYTMAAPAQGGQLSLLITRARTRIEPVVSSDSVKYRVQIDAEYDVAEISGVLDVTRPTVQRALSQRLTETIRGDITAALDILQGEYQCDVLGFGDMLYRHAPHLWRRLAPQWPRVFAALPVEIDVRARMRSSGRVLEPLPKKGGPR